MQRRLTEGPLIFLNVMKWFILASIVGTLVGLSTSAFLRILKWGVDFTGQSPSYWVFLPLGLLASALIVRFLASDAEGHGTERVIEAVHKRSGRIDPKVVPVKLAATVITLASGGSVGKEGPCAQIGAGIASIFASIVRLEDRDRKKIVICGISAGFAAVFGTPFAGAIFGIEVLAVGVLLYDVLLPSFIAGITAYQVMLALGVTYSYFPVKFLPMFSEAFFVKVVLSGLFFGLCAFLMIEFMRFGKIVSERMRISFWSRALVGGIVMVGLVELFSARYTGLGIETIHDALNGEHLVWYAFLLKMVFTGITLNFGGSGGIVTPIFFVGAASGALFGELMGLNPATFAAIGFVAVLAGAANTPIAASIMSVELFGPKIAPYAAVACVVSFLMTGHRSVYAPQILAVKKFESSRVEIGRGIEDVHPRSGVSRILTRSWIRAIRFFGRRRNDKGAHDRR